MVVVNKIKQLEGKSFYQLVDLAKADGKTTNHEIAIWIIAHSIPWKSKGYKCILEEMDKHLEGEEVNERSKIN